MAYSELIKDFRRIRAYLRDFYVYGFKVRGEFTEKSGRSYDNERRRVESWMGDYVSFTQDSRGKRVFLSMDSRSIPHNPLYQAFKAKSFTQKDILLHFCLLDLFRDQACLKLRDILPLLEECYPNAIGSMVLDEKTVRANTRGAALCSGAGTASFKHKFDGNVTPMSHMLRVLMSDRYKEVHA